MDGLPGDVQKSLNELAVHYENFEQNDRGANGYMFFAQNKVTNASVAIKFYAGEQGEAQHDEPRQLCAIKSRNVLPILDARSVSHEWGYFVTPRCFEGDVDDLIAVQPSVHRAIDVALGICNGVSAIHAMRMLHRDLKPGNIMLSGGSPQIADFGSVRMLTGENEHVTASKHSILFRPPESFATGTYTAKGDLYQIGIVAYQMLGGNLSYDGEAYLAAKERKQFEQIQDPVDRSIFVDHVIRDRATKGSLLDYRSLPPWVTAAARQALRAVTHPDPQQRLATVADVAAALTKLRASLLNWRWTGDVAVLQGEGRVIELRPINEEPTLYQAYQSGKDGGSFRRIPGAAPARLCDVLRQL